MLDRFLVIAEANELAARIVINKVELASEAARAKRCSPTTCAPATRCIYTSTKDGGRGLEPLHDALQAERRRSRARPASESRRS